MVNVVFVTIAFICAHTPRQIACVGFVLFYRVTTTGISFARHRAKPNAIFLIFLLSLFCSIIKLNHYIWRKIMDYIELNNRHQAKMRGIISLDSETEFEWVNKNLDE